MRHEKTAHRWKKPAYSILVFAILALSAQFFAYSREEHSPPGNIEPAVIKSGAQSFAPATQGAAPPLATSAPTTPGRPLAGPAAATPPPIGQTSATLPCQVNVERSGRIVLNECHAAEKLPRGEAGARHFLSAYASTLGLNEDLSALAIVEVKHGLGGTRTLFNQQLDGLPVHDAQVSVNQDVDGKVTGVFSTYQANSVPLPSRVPSLTARQAEDVARNAAQTTSVRMPSKIEPAWLVSSGSEVRLGWRLMVYSAEPLGDFLTLVDDASAKVLLQENRIAFATGSGLIYQPNPIQTSGNAGLTDGGDSASTALNAERVEVTLSGLVAGIGTLRGEFVDLVSLAGGLTVPDADEPTRVYEYDRSDKRFEQVTIYSTVDAIQRYFHSLGFDDDTGIANGIRDFPSLANAHWNTADQSFYSTGDDAIHFGDGGVDDGEDADIIVHEYGHAIQHNQNACWGGGEMGAMGEGFGDYLAASFFADAGDTTFQSSNAACVGEWDASAFSSSNPPCLRRVDGNKQYPDDLVGAVHPDGEIWSRALWDIRQSAGASVTDQLVLEHHFLVPCNASMVDAANQILQADTNLNGSANHGAIRTAFCDRGIFSGTNCTDIGMTQSLSPDPPVAGRITTVTLTAINQKPFALTAVGFSSTVPTGSSYVSNSASDSGVESSGTITWPPVDLVAGQQVQRSFSVLLPVGSGSATLFTDDMESGGSLWTAGRNAGSTNWTLSNAQPRSGGSSWFGSDPASTSDKFLAMLTPVTIQPDTILEFWHSYQTESRFDGGVVEASIDGGSNWADLGSEITLNGYPGNINSGAQSAISGRSAFTGDSGGYVLTKINLQSLAGNDALIRFRMVSDTSIGGSGWHVDDVLIISGGTFESTFVTSSGGSSTYTTQVEPAPPNTPPQLAANNGIELLEGSTAVIGTAQLRATDVDTGNTLTYTVSTPPSNGMLVPSSSFTQADIDAGSVSYQHDGSNVLLDGFAFEVSDGQGGIIATTNFAITINPVNDAPTLGLSALPDATVGIAYELTVSPTDPNAGDNLTIIFDSGPAWLGSPVDQGSNTWTLSGTPAASDVGTVTVTLRVRDSGSPALEDQDTFTLIVQPHTPAEVPAMGSISRLIVGLFALLTASAAIGSVRRAPRRSVQIPE